jgi:hypothetical protein
MGADVREEVGEFPLQFKDFNWRQGGTTEVATFDELFPVKKKRVLAGASHDLCFSAVVAAEGTLRDQGGLRR